jgi:conjugation system TraG family ATPase
MSKAGDCSIGFQIMGPEIFTSAENDFEALHSAWVKAIRLLPAGTVLHIQDWYVHHLYRQDRVGKSFLSDASERHFHMRPYLDHRCFCYLTLPAKDRKPTNSAASTLFRGSLLPQYLIQSRQLEEFIDQANQFTQVLEDSGLLQLRRVIRGELISTSSYVGLIEQYCFLTLPPALPELVDVGITSKLSVGNADLHVYTLADAEHLPLQCKTHVRNEKYSTDRSALYMGFANPLGPLLDFDHIYNQYIIVEDPVVVSRRMETRRRRLQSLSSHSRENAVTKDAIDGYLQEMATGQRMPVKAHFNIIAWTSHPAEEKDLKNKVSSAISRLGAIPHLETVGASMVWWAGIPGNAADLPTNEMFDSFAEQATCFLSPETNYRSSNSPFGFRLGDRLTGRPLHVDISDEPMRKMINNRGKFVLGGSGAGKSYFMNHLVRSYHEQGAHIVIVDIGNSYKGLCEFLDGYYFTYSKSNPIRFNPFWLEEGEELDIEKKESIKALLVALWKSREETFLRSEYVALSNALTSYYEFLKSAPDIFPCFDSFYEFLQTGFMRELADHHVREKDFDVENFLYVLRPYYRGGEYDFLLNAKEKLNVLDQRLVIFEIDAIKDHPILFSATTIVLTQIFISKIRKLPGVRKLMLIEEAWKAIAKEGMDEYIRYLYKTIRKFYGEPIMVCQEVEDIISSPVVKKAVIGNSDCKILLDLSNFQHSFQDIQQLLSLTDKDKALVLSLNKANDSSNKYKEVFIKLGPSYSKVYRTEVSLEEYLVYTTEEPEKVKVQEYARKHGGYRAGIEKLATDIRSGAVRFMVILAMFLAGLLAPGGIAMAQVPIADVIKEAIKKVIVATDLEIQRLQTQTILLQNAQKAIENTMAQLHLDEITEWVQDQEDLFSSYCQELWRVKSALAAYQKIKTLITREEQLATATRQACSAIQQDPHFSAEEVNHMLGVYDGILAQAVAGVGKIMNIIEDFVTQMDDAGRLQIIDETADRSDKELEAFSEFTEANILVSLQRAREGRDLAMTRALYGIN